MTDAPLRTGLNPGITLEQYLNAPGLANHGISKLLISPAHYRSAHGPDREPEVATPAMLTGSALDCMILEPDEWDERYVVLDGHPDLEGTLRSADEHREACRAYGIKPLPSSIAMMQQKLREIQAPVQFYSDAVAEITNGRTMVTQDEYDLWCRIRDAVRAHPAVAFMLKTGVQQATVFGVEPDTLTQTKCRPDWMPGHINGLMDLKSTRDARPADFSRSVYNYGYHRAAWWYPQVIRWAGLRAPETMLFVAYEKEPPFGVRVYELDEVALARGEQECREALATYVECSRTNVWPCYPQTVERLSLPGWVR